MDYSVAFFYGFYLEDKEVANLLKRIEKYDPPSEAKRAEAFDMEGWYWNEFNDGDIHEIWSDITALFSGPVGIETVFDIDGMYLYFLVIKETVYSVDDTVIPFELAVDTGKWDNLIKSACEEMGITWKQPQFQFIIDYCPQFHSSYYEGDFFYGVVLTQGAEETRGKNLENFVKNIFKNDRELFLQRGGRHNYCKYDPGWIYEVGLEVSEELARKVNQASKDLGLFLNSVFDSDEFNTWCPSDHIVGEMLSHETLHDLDGIWAKRGDPIAVGWMYNLWGIEVYLAIRTTIHRAGEVEETSFDFEFEAKDRAEWDRLLREKCKEYGLECNAPSFYILRDNT